MPKMINYQFVVLGVLSGVLCAPVRVQAVEQGSTVWVVDEATPFRQPLGVEVTGTAILNPSSKNALPVQVLERKDIERLGVHTAVALLQRLSVMVNSGDLGLSMLRPGPETAAIHGYEAGTLVLLNGRRLGIYPMQMVSANADLMVPDLGKVPLRAIERVEILTDGASTRYGSDAIAGVLNIITRKPFDGWEIGAAVQQPQGAGGTERSGGLSWGRGGKKGDTWGVQWHLSWRQRDAVVASQRGLTTADRRQMGTTADGKPVYAPPSAALTPYGAPAQPVTLGAPPGLCADGYGYVAEYGACLQDNGARLMVYPSERQVSLFGAWEHEVRPELHLFADVLLNDYSKTLIRDVPAGVVFATDTGQPHLLMAEPLGLTHVTDRTLSRVLTGGARGVLDKVDYKLTLSHAHHLGSAVLSGGGSSDWYRNVSLTAAELRQSPADYSAQTLAEFARWQADDVDLITAEAQSYQAEALLSGKWDASDGLERRWAAGAGFLEDSINSRPGAGSPNGPTYLKRQSSALFGELEADLSERLLTGVSWRLDHYSDVGNATTGKFKAKWRFNSQGFVRMSWGTGFRAPSMRQMDAQAVRSLSMRVDPAATGCDFSRGFAGRDQAIACAGSEIYNVGNTDLRPERARNFNLGVRHEPSAAWSWGMDYWSLQVKDIFGSLNYNDILSDPTLYAVYATLPAPGTPERINLVAQNLGRLDRRGIDYDIHFRQTTDWGRFRASLGGTYYLRSKRAFLPGAPSVNELGQYIYQTERYVPRNKVRLLLQLDRSSWSYTAILDAISGNSERVEGVTAVGQSVTLNRRVPMHWTLGLMAKHIPNRGVELYAGIDNLFDRLPPSRYASPASQGYVPGLDTRYGSYWGRTFKLGLNLKF